MTPTAVPGTTTVGRARLGADYKYYCHAHKVYIFPPFPTIWFAGQNFVYCRQCLEEEKITIREPKLAHSVLLKSVSDKCGNPACYNNSKHPCQFCGMAFCGSCMAILDSGGMCLWCADADAASDDFAISGNFACASGTCYRAGTEYCTECESYICEQHMSELHRNVCKGCVPDEGIRCG